MVPVPNPVAERIRSYEIPTDRHSKISLSTSPRSAAASATTARHFSIWARSSFSSVAMYGV